MTWAQACGSSGNAGSPAASAGGASTGAPAAGLHPLHAAGDYDSDDYEAGRDADDDDSTGPLDRDGDSDGSRSHILDSDDSSFTGYGHPAGASETRSAGAFVARYLAVAAAGAGARACSMVSAPVASTIAMSLGGPNGRPYERGGTCTEVLSKLFAFYHRQLSVEARVLRLTLMRVQGTRAMAVLTARSGFPDRLIELRQERVAWKVYGVLDNELS